MNFNQIEFVELAFNWRSATAISDYGMVNTSRRRSIEKDATPVPGCSTCGRKIICRVKGPPNPVFVVQDRGHDDRTLFRAFCEEVRIAQQSFDSGSPQLHNNARVHFQTAT